MIIIVVVVISLKTKLDYVMVKGVNFSRQSQLTRTCSPAANF